MTQLKSFRETMTEIGNIFGFHDIQLDELEKYYKLEIQNVDAFNKKRINTILFLNNYSDETAIMLEFAKLYVQLQQVRIRTNNTNVGFLIESSPTPRVYTTLETLVEYLVNYHNTFTDTKVLLYRIKQIQPIELI